MKPSCFSELRVEQFNAKDWAVYQIEAIILLFGVKILQTLSKEKIPKKYENNCNFIKYGKFPMKILSTFLLRKVLKAGPRPYECNFKIISKLAICEARSRKKWDGRNRPFDRHVTVSAAVVNLICMLLHMKRYR